MEIAEADIRREAEFTELFEGFDSTAITISSTEESVMANSEGTAMAMGNDTKRWQRARSIDTRQRAMPTRSDNKQ